MNLKSISIKLTEEEFISYELLCKKDGRNVNLKTTLIIKTFIKNSINRGVLGSKEDADRLIKNAKAISPINAKTGLTGLIQKKEVVVLEKQKEIAPPKNNEHIIYALIDPQTHKVRYVGRTKIHPEVRLHAHVVDKKGGGKRYWIDSLINKGLRPIIKELERTIEENVQICERKWINFYQNEGCDLLNINQM